MGQFKPMVKMMTTEPSIELKLKKGGKVEKKMQMGGSPDMAAPAMPSMPARGGMMGAKAPMKPSMAARRRAMRAMPAGAAPAAPVGMAAQVMKEGGETKSMHKAEMAKMSKTAKALKEHADKPASKAHKGLKTGGVVMGQGGYKKGGSVKMAGGGLPKSGIINTENQGGEYRNTKMHTAKPDHSPAKTGDVKMGNAGGYATGGVAKANAGGYKKGGKIKGMMDGGMMGEGMMGDAMYKKGGAAKKAYATGGVVDSGAPVAMPQGRKKPSAPVSINELSGTFKKGGSVTPAEARLLKANKAENATAMRQAKAYSNEVYSKYGRKMKEGGLSEAEKRAMEQDRLTVKDPQATAAQARRGVEDALNPLGIVKELYQKGKDYFKKPGAVTKTEKSVTVMPEKKRGGLATC
jgi:hypothetical protein